MKCEHSTTIVNYTDGVVSVETCSWGCGQKLVSIVLPNGNTVTKTTEEWTKLLYVSERESQKPVSNP